MEISLYSMTVVLLGYFVLGTAGFGSALIIVPLLAWNWPLAFVVPLVLLIDVPAAVLHTGLNFRQVMWRELPPLLPSVFVGALTGIGLIHWTHGEWLLLLFGGYVIFIGWRGLQGASSVVQLNASAIHFSGFAMGLVETMFGTAGPVVMSWLSHRVSDPFLIRATMPMTIIGLSSIALGMVGASGGLGDDSIWTALAALLPFALAGVWLGHQISRQISAAVLRPFIYGFLCLSGFVLCARALRGVYSFVVN
ncbi:MAG: hypothetical protein RL462_820 [Pseudomonadota bacterium]|jgi:uncharacterized membrane protein YfcA